MRPQQRQSCEFYKFDCARNHAQIIHTEPSTVHFSARCQPRAKNYSPTSINIVNWGYGDGKSNVVSPPGEGHGLLPEHFAHRAQTTDSLRGGCLQFGQKTSKHTSVVKGSPSRVAPIGIDGPGGVGDRAGEPASRSTARECASGSASFASASFTSRLPSTTSHTATVPDMPQASLDIASRIPPRARAARTLEVVRIPGSSYFSLGGSGGVALDRAVRRAHDS